MFYATTDETFWNSYTATVIRMNEYGTQVEWHWQGKNEVLWVKRILVLICPPQIPYGFVWDWSRASAMTGRRLTAWAMTRLLKIMSLF
jgi:hypothetical protein